MATYAAPVIMLQALFTLVIRPVGTQQLLLNFSHLTLCLQVKAGNYECIYNMMPPF